MQIKCSYLIRYSIYHMIAADWILEVFRYILLLISCLLLLDFRYAMILVRKGPAVFVFTDKVLS